MRIPKIAGAVFTVFLSTASALAAKQDTGARYRIACRAELTHGSGSKVLQAESKLFPGNERAGGEKVEIRFGKYVLIGEIEMIVERGQATVPVAPPANPELKLRILSLGEDSTDRAAEAVEGSAKRPPAVKGGRPDTIFLANLEGVRWPELARPLAITGYQFREFVHEKVKYTRLDYRCALEPAAK